MTSSDTEPLPAGLVPDEIDEFPPDMEKAEKTVTDKSRIEFPPSIWGRSKAELWMFILIIGCSAQISTLAIPSFFPTIPILTEYFDTTTENINLTATIYSIFQGVSPLFWAGLSDSYGRRPIYIASIALAIVANFCLANAKSYGALFGLRILQAFGGATTVSLLAAVVGDITERKNRGGVAALLNGFQSMGNCFGPLIGGAVMYRWNWRAVFYLLGCHAALLWLLIIIFIPETNRHYSGNGNLIPKRLINKSPYAWFHHKINGVPYAPQDPEYSAQWLPPPHKVNFLRWIYLLKQVDVILILTPNAIIYTSWYMVLTSMSTNLTDNLHFDSLKVGFCYLSSGIGALTASLTAGRSMNWNYRRRARQLEKTNDGSELNIYQVRLELTFWAMITMVIGTIVYGWTFHFKVSYIVPVVMTFFVSFAATYFLGTSTVILVDLFPDDSAASTSCVNLTRCLLCAAGLAALDKMQVSMTIGGTYTFLGLLCGVSWICVWIEMKYGRKFYEERKQRERQLYLGGHENHA